MLIRIKFLVVIKNSTVTPGKNLAVKFSPTVASGEIGEHTVNLRTEGGGGGVWGLYVYGVPKIL